MSTMKNKLLGVLWLLLVQTLTAQQTGNPELGENSRYGQLPNGLTYYIKSLETPMESTHLRLWVKSKIDPEDSLTLDFPHALEHLAFKSTKHFPKGLPNQMEMLEKAGMENVGRGFNAFSSNFLTVYNFDAPSGNDKALQLGLLWLYDIAGGDLSMQEKDIQAVRGELKQETLLRQGTETKSYFAVSRLESKLFPCHKDDTGYFKFLRNFPSDSLRAFYRKNYRPESMAIALVGNFDDLAQVEEKLTQKFATIKAISGDIGSPCYEAYFQRPPQFVKVSQAIDTFSPVAQDQVKMQLLFRDPLTYQQLSKLQGIKRLMYWEMFTNILNQRLRWAAENYDRYYRIFGKYSYDYDNSPPALVLHIASAKQQEWKGLTEAMELFTQFYKWGPTPNEWKTAKESCLAAWKPQRKQPASYWLKGIEEHYAYGKMFPVTHREKLYRWLKKMNREEFTKAIPSLVSATPTDIGMVAPEEHAALALTEKEVRTKIKEAARREYQAYHAPITPTTVLAQPFRLKKAAYTLVEDHPERKEKTIRLANGVKVVLKSFRPSEGSEQDKINIKGFKPAGARCFPKEDYDNALRAPEIVVHSGVGELNKFELERLLSTKGMTGWNVRPYIHNYESGIQATGTPEEVETLLQLIYLYFSQPRHEKAAFENWAYQEQKMYLNPVVNLDIADINTAMGEFTGDLSSRPQGTRRFEGLERTSYERAYRIYQQLLGNAEDFTFLISGDFKMEKLVGLAQQYLGNLPVTGKQVLCAPATGKKLPEGPLHIEVPVSKNYHAKNANYRLQFIHPTKNLSNWRERIKVEALAAVTAERAWRIRYEKGVALYYLNVKGHLNRENSRYELTFRFECNPEDWKLLKAECEQIIQEVKSGSLKEEFFKLGLKRMQKKYSVKAQRRHQEVKEQLYRKYRFGEEVPPVQVVREYINSLDQEAIMETAKKYFKNSDKYEFVRNGKQ